MLALQALVGAVAGDAAQDEMSHTVTLGSNSPLADHSATPEAPVFDEENCPNRCEAATEQAAAMPGEGSRTGTSDAVVSADKGVAQKKRIVVDIRADCSSAASHNLDRR